MKSGMQRLWEQVEKDKQVPDYIKSLMLEMLAEVENMAAAIETKMLLVYFRTKQNIKEEEENASKTL